MRSYILLWMLLHTLTSSTFRPVSESIKFMVDGYRLQLIPSNHFSRVSNRSVVNISHHVSSSLSTRLHTVTRPLSSATEVKNYNVNYMSLSKIVNKSLESTPTQNEQDPPIRAPLQLFKENRKQITEPSQLMFLSFLQHYRGSRDAPEHNLQFPNNETSGAIENATELRTQNTEIVGSRENAGEQSIQLFSNASYGSVESDPELDFQAPSGENQEGEKFFPEVFPVDSKEEKEVEENEEITNEEDEGYDALGCGVGSVEARVLGGRATRPGRWPWQVALVHVLTGHIFCGASLLNVHYLLTAGHCASLFPKKVIKVVLGSYNQTAKHEKGRVYRRVSHVIVHEDYRVGTLANDVALLRLAKPVNMTRTVRPVCLPDREDWDVAYAAGEAGKYGTVTGWGLTGERGNQSALLLEVVLPLVSVEECSTKYQWLTTVTDNMLCTLHRPAAANAIRKDSCKGDSGGPLVVQDDQGRWTQLGVVSFGYGCGRDYPGVYTRVARYLLWIYLKIVHTEISAMS